MDVSGKIAIVTGGGSIIGRGISEALAHNGATVVVASRNVANTRDIAEIIESIEGATRQKHSDMCLDVTNQESVDSMVRQVISRYGKIDILVNNAGVIAAPGWEGHRDATEEDWRLAHEVNVLGLKRIVEAVVPHMKKRRSGKIVNISSIAGRGGNKAHVPPSYGASKAGIINLTQTWALAYAQFNINVNAVCPGPMWTPMWEKIGQYVSAYSDDESERGCSPKEVFNLHIKKRIPLGRAPTPKDIGAVVAFLVSDCALNITGQTINVSGGSHMN